MPFNLLAFSTARPALDSLDSVLAEILHPCLAPLQRLQACRHGRRHRPPLAAEALVTTPAGAGAQAAAALRHTALPGLGPKAWPWELLQRDEDLRHALPSLRKHRPRATIA